MIILYLMPKPRSPDRKRDPCRSKAPWAVSAMAVLDEAHWQHADVAAGRADGPVGDFYKGTGMVFRVRNSDRFESAANLSLRRDATAGMKCGRPPIFAPFRVGPGVRIPFAPAGSLSQR
jgi:hypothetical protein